jgi:hypothetical protein
MSKPSATPRIAPQPSLAKLSRDQLTFNKLVEEIHANRARLATWQEFLPQFHQRVTDEHEPVLRNFHMLQAAMVRAFDQALDRKGLTQAERDVLQDVICMMAGNLLIDNDDEELKAIYNKHSSGDVDAESAAALDSIKSAVQQMYGLDPADIADLDSPEEIFARAQAHVDAADRQRAEAKETHRTNRKNAKERSNEEKQALDAAETNLSLREVYRKLVSALHPDRERDAAERQRKTALMQRVNEAYANKDILQLLELQLELEQIDATTIANLPATRLKHFNKILKAQLAELQQEIVFLELPLRRGVNLQSRRSIDPKAVMAGLTREIRELKQRTRMIEADMHVPRSTASLKRWIKEYKRYSDE